MTKTAFTTELNRLTDETRALWYLPNLSTDAPQWPEIVRLAASMKELIDANPGHYAAHRAQKVGA